MENDFVLVLDFGGQQAQSMARKLRAQNYYCEVHSGDISPDTVQRKGPRGLLLAGGSDGVALDPQLLRLGIPALAMGACARAMAQLLGAASEGAVLAGRASQIDFLPCPLFDGLGASDRFFDRVDALRLPEGFEPIATTEDGLVPAFADLSANLYGLQFYAESNDPDGAQILANFAGRICGCNAYWSSEFYIAREMEYLRERIGEGRAIMAISGGVDSTVCAVLMHRAIGERLKCVFVDTGLLRKGEAEKVPQVFREQLGLNPVVVDARARTLEALRGLAGAREKRRAVEEVFLAAMRAEAQAEPGAEFLVAGTNYADLLSGDGDRIPDDGALKRIEPIRMLFKDEVRAIGDALGIPKELLNRQPFPGPGLAVRCAGEVTEERLALLRDADAIFREEIVSAGLDRKLTHYFVVLTDIRTLGRRDGGEASGYACALRAVNAPDASNVSVAKLPYDLIERVVQRITTQIPEINHVLYDVTGKPVAMVEWA